MKRRLSETEVKIEAEEQTETLTLAQQVATALLAPLTGSNRFGRVAFGQQEQSVNAFLHQKLGKDSLSRRPGPGGRKLTYIESCKAIELANRAFGFNGWSCHIVECKEEYKEKKGDRWSIAYSALVRIELKDGTSHEDVGFGTSDGQRDLGAALEQAKKASISDARKRALRLFGEYLGNSCYDREHIKDVNANRPMAPLAAAPNVILPLAGQPGPQNGQNQAVQQNGGSRPPGPQNGQQNLQNGGIKPPGQQNQNVQQNHQQNQVQQQRPQNHTAQQNLQQNGVQQRPQNRTGQNEQQGQNFQQNQQRPQNQQNFQQNQAQQPMQQQQQVLYPLRQQMPAIQHQPPQVQQQQRQSIPQQRPQMQQQSVQQQQQQQQHWKPPQVLRNPSTSNGSPSMQHQPIAVSVSSSSTATLQTAAGKSVNLPQTTNSSSPFRPQPQRWVSSNAPPPPRMMASNYPPTIVKSEHPAAIQAQPNAQFNVDDLSLSQFDYNPNAENNNPAKKMRSS